MDSRGHATTIFRCTTNTAGAPADRFSAESSTIRPSMPENLRVVERLNVRCEDSQKMGQIVVPDGD
jgi:hypothetical protein